MDCESGVGGVVDAMERDFKLGAPVPRSTGQRPHWFAEFRQGLVTENAGGWQCQRHTAGVAGQHWLRLPYSAAGYDRMWPLNQAVTRWKCATMFTRFSR